MGVIGEAGVNKGYWLVDKILRILSQANYTRAYHKLNDCLHIYISGLKSEL